MIVLMMICWFIKELILKMFCSLGVMLTLKGILEKIIGLYCCHVIIIIISKTVLEKLQAFFFLLELVL